MSESFILIDDQPTPEFVAALGREGITVRTGRSPPTVSASAMVAATL